MAAVRIRPATQDDAAFMLAMADMASNGFVRVLFSASTPPGRTVEDHIRNRMRGETSGLSWKNCVIAEMEGRAAGYMALDRVAEISAPLDDAVPAVFRPLLELESMAPGSVVINLLAVVPDCRGQGIGQALLAHAEAGCGPAGLCLTVADDNAGAIAVYRRFGFDVVARRAMVTQGWVTGASDWLLMVKP